MPAREIDWLELWRELATQFDRAARSGPARRYESHLRQKGWQRPDRLLDFILQNTGSQDTAIDVGAGGGRWAIPIARIASGVTAVEPSPSMVEMLRENIAAARLSNVHIIQAAWESASVEPHDVVVSAHAIYVSPDFAAIIRKMERRARKRCYLALRLPLYNGIIGELCLAIRGHRHDSPNAIIAYNALYSMGIYTNVLMEEGVYRWTDSSFEDAFARARRHLHLGSSTAHDALVRDTLARRLTCADGIYTWPDGMLSALLWWNPSPDK